MGVQAAARMPWRAAAARGSSMKLATYKDGSRDGQLVVVSRDLSQAHYATGIASRLQQVLARLSVSLLDVFSRNEGCLAQLLTLLAPAWNVPVEELGERRRRPASRVHAVGNRMDGIAGEQTVGHFPVFHGHTVDIWRIRFGDVSNAP